ncbi:uncharacterized protein EV154DRAFT_491226 [Mucor mucedo]|uniref:uncharacterized protein n=1 Tax=Mucor mucedo TaxID=29922 RepID=UPI00221F307C|nr:uncharacterized protein EV154DRAFT_491226 [Mucor mucedo]KAI7896919.1 hypothetical protein EV154DRAFT_491226 [Mucor mucedo]
MHILDLPVEIFQIILDISTRRDLYELAFACKSWNVPALQRWYSEVLLDNYSYKVTMNLFKPDAEQRDKYFQYGPLVKLLEIGVPDPDFEDPATLWQPDTEDFISLLKYFPNLLVLNINDTRFADGCLIRIAHGPFVDVMPNVQQITTSVAIFQTASWRNHFAACYAHRATITTLNTCFLKNMLKGRDTINLLSDFTQLSDLTIMKTRPGSISIAEILMICPNLKALDYKDCDMSEEFIKSFLENGSTINALNTNLETLKLWVPSLSVNYVRYITNYFSSQLRFVDLNLHGTNYHIWLDEIGLDNAYRLVERLKKTGNFQLKWAYFNESNEITSNASGSTIKDFFKLVNTSKAGENTFIRSTFNTFPGYLLSYEEGTLDLEEDGDFQNRIEYNSKTGYNVNYKLEPSNFNCFNPRFLNGDMPYTSSQLEITEWEHINVIHVNLVSDFSRPATLFEFLQLALINCPRLEFFKLISSVPSKYKIRMMIGKDIDHFVKRQQEEHYHQISTNTKNNLKAVKFDNFLPSQQLLDLMSIHLPNIKTIACLGIDVDDVDSNRRTIDLTNFENLDNVYVMVDNLPHYFEDYIVHLQFTDGNESYYYQNSECRKSLGLKYSEFVDLCLDSGGSALVVTIKCKKNINTLK